MVNIKLDGDIELKLKPHLKKKGDLDKIANEAFVDWLDKQEGVEREGEEEEGWGERIERRAKEFAGLE